MALTKYLEWEVNAGAAGASDNNGGAFDATSGTPGTNYTYGAGLATYSITDLAIDASDSTKVTSATDHPFTSADVGNVIKIASGTGFTTGRFQVMSVAAGVATMDRSMGTTSSSGGHGVLGGALANPGEATVKGMVAGNIVWIKGGYTYTCTTYDYTSGGACLPFVVASSGGGLISMIRGYNSAHGDVPTIAQQPIIYSDSTSMTFGDYVVKMGAAAIAMDIYIKSNNVVSVYCAGNSSQGGGFKRCSFEEGRYAAIANADWVDACYFKNCGRAGGSGVGGGYIRRSYFIIPSGCAGAAPANNGEVSECIFNGGTNGVSMPSYGAQVHDNSFYNQSGSGVKGTAFDGYGTFYIERNVFSTIGAYCIDMGNTRPILSNNKYYSATSGFCHNTYIDDGGNASLTGDPYTSAGTGDFSLNNTSGAGADCRSISFEFPGL